MKHILLLGLIYAGLVHGVMAQTNVQSSASQLEAKGQFDQASALLKAAIAAHKSSPAELKTLEFDLDRLERIKKDFSYTKENLYRDLKNSIKGLTPAEYDGWIKQGWFQSREINGKLYYFSDEARNIFFRHPELNERSMPPIDRREEQARWDTITTIKKAALADKTPYVLPKTFRVTMNVTAESNVAPAGETIRAWVPIPRRYPFQYDFKLLSSTVKPKSIASEDSPIRSVYFEQAAQAGNPTQFKIEYEFTARGVYFDLNPAKIQPYDPKDETLKRYTSESPHVTFTPELKALSAKIVGNETNPMLKAKRIYDWLSDNLHYSYSLEYSTIRNISDTCRATGFGDCGQQGMLFIALCRLNNVPARWQSGWNLFPHATSNHDWSEIYLAPYGWVPVDQYMGNFAMSYVTTLTQAQKQEMRDFYFGGLDQYRMIANSDHSVPLDPPKNSVRSDDVDFQRGELEYGGKNIYLDKFSYIFNFKEIPSPSLP